MAMMLLGSTWPETPCSTHQPHEEVGNPCVCIKRLLQDLHKRTPKQFSSSNVVWDSDVHDLYDAPWVTHLSFLLKIQTHLKNNYISLLLMSDIILLFTSETNISTRQKSWFTIRQLHWHKTHFLQIISQPVAPPRAIYKQARSWPYCQFVATFATETALSQPHNGAAEPLHTAATWRWTPEKPRLTRT